MCQYNVLSESVKMCSHQEKVLIETTGNNWAPQPYASTSTGPTGTFFQQYVMNLNKFSPPKLNTCLEQNHQVNHLDPVVANFSCAYYKSNHDLSAKSADVNDIKSRPVRHLQGGDEIQLVPDYVNNFNYDTNMTNTVNDFSNQYYHPYLPDPSRNRGHLGLLGTNHHHNMIIQEVNIISQMENDGFTTNASLAFIHPNPISQFQGFYTILTNQVPNLWCPCPEPLTGPIQVSHSFKICHNSFSHDQIRKVLSKESADAKQTYQNILLDQKCQRLYNCLYEHHITSIIDELLGIGCTAQATQECSYKVDKLDVKDHLYDTNTYTNSKQKSSIPPNIEAHVPYSSNHTQVDQDVSIPDKKFGFLNHHHPTFQFIGPDREAVQIGTIEEHLHIAEIIRQTGVPNYVQARIPIASGLNLEAWEQALSDYPDKFLIQYIKFGFPLSIMSPESLHITDVKNHASATNFPEQIQEYIDKEHSLGAMLGPVDSVTSPHFHCSPLMSRPKDTNKRRVILNLSHPYGASLNDAVTRHKFDGRPSTLRFPSIDAIADAIRHDVTDPVLFKIDVARAFRNLRVDPVDATKFGISWQGKFYLDPSVTFGWTHGSAASQMVSDAVTYILKASGCRIFPYIDDYVGVASRDDAERQFWLLYDLLSALGLPINKDKLDPPSDALTCLGIRINIPASSLSIDPHKLIAIHQECFQVSTKKFLSKKNFQSLMGKLIYIHKCVHPARIFINRILDLFRTNSHKKRIHLTPQFHQDLEWFQKFLPHFNGITLFHKPIITDLSPVYIDACLSGIGGIWGTRVYSAPAPVVPDFHLNIVHLEMINLVVAFRLWPNTGGIPPSTCTVTTKPWSRWWLLPKQKTYFWLPVSVISGS